MNDYIEFNRKYKDIILGKLDPSSYNEVTTYVSDLIDDLLYAEAIYVEDLNKFIEFSTVYLLTRTSADKLLNDKDDAKTLGDIVASYIKYNEKNGIKNRPVDLSKFTDTKKGRETNTSSKFESEAIKSISEFLKKYYSIFDTNTNFKQLSYDIYESLIFDGYKEKEIISGSCNRVIVDYIRNKFFDIKFNPEFESMLKFSKEKTNEVFRENEKKKNLTPVEANYYSTYRSLGDMSFRVAAGLSSQGISLKDAKESPHLYNYINKNITAELSRIDSVRKDSIKQMRKQTKVIDFKDAKDDFKKKAIAIAIAFGILAADNIIYNAFHNNKEETKETKEPVAYTVNGEYVPGSYLENIDFESIQRRSTGPSFTEAVENHDWDKELHNLRG